MRKLIKFFLIWGHLFLITLFMPLSACFSMESEDEGEKQSLIQKKSTEIEIFIDSSDEEQDKRHITEERKDPPKRKKSQKNKTEIVTVVPINIEGEENKNRFLNSNIDNLVSSINLQMAHFGISTLSTVRIYTLDSDDDSFNTFAQNMDEAFFRSSSKKVKAARALGSLYGFGVPLAMSGLIMGAIGDVTRAINPALNPILSYGIILPTTFPVALRVGYQRAGAIATSVFGERKYAHTANDEEDTDSKPHISTKNLAHRTAIVLCTVGAGLNALIPTVLMISEEVPYFDTFAAISAPFIWGFYADAYYTMGQHCLRNFFNFYSYHTPNRSIKEHALSTGIDRFLDLINHPKKTFKEDSDNLVNIAYNTFFDVLKRQSSRLKANQKHVEKKNNVLEGMLTEKEIMLFSILLVTDLTREDDSIFYQSFGERVEESEEKKDSNVYHGIDDIKEESEEEKDSNVYSDIDDIREVNMGEDSKREQEIELLPLVNVSSSKEPQYNVENLQKTIKDLRKKIQNLNETTEREEAFKKDLAATRPLWKEAFMETLSQLMVGAAYYGRIEILQTTIEQILIATGVDPATSANIAYAVAISEVSFRTLVETKVHKEEFKGWLSVFSLKKLTNLTFLRKAANLSAALDGIIYTLPSILVGLTAFQDYSISAQAALIAPCAILDFNIFSKLFSRHNNAIITGAATVRKSQSQCTLGKRAHLNRWAQLAKETLPKFDDRTISILYEKLMKGIREKHT
ncbi:MAG: hypothetical protein KBD36_04870 [Alphaproteobacteria bacterium]|nr:hypothetical protein [Alphaproteobacteria bacterium]